MPLIGLLLAGSAIYAGIKTYLQPPEQQRGEENPNESPPPSTHPLVIWVTQIDEHYQTFIQQKIDPLLASKTRQQQLKLLTGESRPVLSQSERQNNRYIGIAGVLIGTAFIGAWLFPPLLIPTVAIVTYLVLPLYQRTFHSLIHEKRLTIDFVTSLFLTGFWFAGYYIFGGILYLIYFMGIKIVFQMEGRSRQKLSHLFGQQPRLVWQFIDGVEVSVPFDQLQAGDIIVVNAGESIPVDGVIVAGLASIDQHLLTGESQPVEKEVGDSVLASTLLLNGRLKIRVEQAGTKTMAAQIEQVLSQTAKYRTNTEFKGMELVHQTVLPTLALSCLAWPVRGFTGAVAVLGASFGANMRTVFLLSMINYLNVASRHHILIKDGRALERLKEVDTVVFDKTGTLTLEQPHVVGLHLFQNGVSETELLTYAATAEYRQPHPIAKAILAEATARNLSLPEIDEASYEVGYGIQVLVKQKLIRVGSERFMSQDGLTIPPSIQTLQAECRRQGQTLVMVAVNGQIVGALELQATVRPEAAAVVKELQQRQLSVRIISGDQEEPTRKLADTLGIESYFANILPENKASLIEQLQQEGRVVCFIGDGINDAIALKQADVSISLRGATTIATDTAQIVLMDQSLQSLGHLLTLADQFDQTLHTGFLTTMVPGLISVGGVFVAGFGIYAVETLFILGFFSGLGVAMKPLLTALSKDDNEQYELPKE
ncbi:MAG: hypothetical protein BWK78_03060 [Thiotrichaceae bacterium IS1]|nr:MAG: hypothetical protein BWK78_03060 [Thiotrichaceae bacterium IS1]